MADILVSFLHSLEELLQGMLENERGAAEKKLKRGTA
jgi:hypothetical protein